ncbi:MAG: DM13 domain-containing protein [Gemmataceae bacterium]
MLLAQGMFHGVAHGGKGTAALHRLTGGERVLRFTDFETSNGPALHVYLIAAADAADNATVTSAAFVDLGPLKGNIGEQNYAIPADVDLSKYHAVTIWCSRFNVNFATAPLKQS